MANETLETIFLDTSFVVGLMNPQDKFHTSALGLVQRIRVAQLVVTTEAILAEIADTFASSNRIGASRFIQDSYRTSNIIIRNITTELFHSALALYESREDKSWGLTDCISFTVMKQENLTVAATADRHFIQAGFRALMLENR